MATAITAPAPRRLQALFELGEDVTVTYRARYTGNAADFAWVLAVCSCSGLLGQLEQHGEHHVHAVRALLWG